MATNTAHDRYVGKIPSQETLRSTAVWFDQHRNTNYRNAKGEAIFANGRPYYSIIEIRSRMPVGPVMPLEWEAPIYAPQKYLLSSIGRITNLATKNAAHEGLQRNTITDRFRIDYEAMEREDREATLEHWRLATNTAIAQGWEPPKFGAPMDPRLVLIVGPAPRSPKIAQAFKAENPWALGMLMPVFNPTTGRTEVEEDEELARILRLNRSDLMTPEQAERDAEAWEARERARKEVAHPDVVSDAKKVLAEVEARIAEFKAMQGGDAAPAKRGPGRPKKASTVAAGAP